MQKQLKGIGIILFSILLMLFDGNEPFFDLSFDWGFIYILIGLVGLWICFSPKDEKAAAEEEQEKSNSDQN